MGLFGDDKRRDERLDALEQHIRVLTETVQPGPNMASMSPPMTAPKLAPGPRCRRRFAPRCC